MKRCLIVVDYQNDFVCGSLGFDKAKQLDEPICKKIEEYRNAGGDIIFTLDTHGKEYMKTREGRFLPVEHCIKGSDGTAFTVKLQKRQGKATCILKKALSGQMLCMNI